MSYSLRREPLPAVAPGNAHFLLKHVFTGPVPGRSAYIHAGLHADETPGLLVAQHLLRLLHGLEREGLLRGQIVVLPYANPVGMAQKIFGVLGGRFYLENGENFNRNFPCIATEFQRTLPAQAFAPNDLVAFKKAFQALLPARPLDPVAATKWALLQEALQHDIVLDLHCDTSGVVHLYGPRDQQQRAARLARAVGAQALVLESQVGGKPFDESYALPWKALRAAGLVDEAQQGFSCTIELRGQSDVDDTTAYQDALGIIDFLTQEGLLAPGVRPALADHHEVDCYPTEGLLHVPSPATGLVVYHRRTGEQVRAGDLLAEIVLLDAEPGAARIQVHSDIDGLFLVRQSARLVRAGQRIALLAGQEPLAHRAQGELLMHF
nr:succinylglutamate desuccinylase/aspartoacylase family protein [uncultured Albidiferax sp.]